MAPGNDLAPLKRVLQLGNVSRATLWRVSRAGVAGFPEPTKRGGRIYWRLDELEALKAAIERFEGRTAFDRRRASARRRVQMRLENLASLKRGKARVRRARRSSKAEQGDLFSDAL